jgi:PIN domain nuclease of toxin-antitoxin system
MPSLILIDTHVLLWSVDGGPILPAARATMQVAGNDGALCVSAVSAWELGVLTAKKRMALSSDLEAWWLKAISVNELVVLPIDAQIAIAATRLPGEFHADPADRFLVATARHHDMPLVTADKRILAYAKAGHMKAIRAR